MLGGWFEFVLTTVIPVLVVFVSMVESVITGLKSFGEALTNPTPENVEKILSGASEAILSPGSLGFRLGASAGEAEAKTGDKREAVNRGLADTIRSLQLSLGPKAQISGIGEIGRQIQLAALNNDPIEARLLKVQQDALLELQSINAKINERDRPGRVYDPPPAGGKGSAPSGGVGLSDLTPVGLGARVGRFLSGG
jgi:hypothetical protein